MKKINCLREWNFVFVFGRKFDDYVTVSINGKTKNLKLK